MLEATYIHGCEITSHKRTHDGIGNDGIIYIHSSRSLDLTEIKQQIQNEIDHETNGDGITDLLQLSLSIC